MRATHSHTPKSKGPPMWHNRQRLSTLCSKALLACAASGALAFGSATANADEERRVSFEGGADIYNKYYFRGFLEEDKGFIFQPWAELGFNLYEADGALSSIDLTIGTWNSLHSEAPGEGVFRGYETDFYAGIGASVLDGIDLDLVYTAYLSPSGAFSRVEELAFAISYDDAALWNDRFALNPHVLIAQEVAGSHDAYLEVGIAPGYDIYPANHAIALAFPVTVGLSLDDYYVTEAGDEVFYGYTQAGITATTALPFIPPAYGTWQLTVGAHYLHLGQAARELNDGDNHDFIASIGVSMGF